MQARINPATAGRSWIREGWRLFRLQPAGFIILLFVYAVGISLVNLMIDLVGRGLAGLVSGSAADVLGNLGSLFVGVLVPGLSVGFMEACRVAENKQQIQPQLLIKAFTVDRQTSRGLLVLGAVYAIAMGIILSVAFSADLPALAPVPKGSPPPQLPPGAAVDVLMVVGGAMLAYLPVAMVLWYAPVLVAWHRMSPLKAMFFSLAACWRNRAAFAVYFLVWGVYALAIPALGAILRLAGLGNASVMIMLPLIVILIAWIYCSFYASYTGVLIADPPAPPEVTPLPDHPPA